MSITLFHVRSRQPSTAAIAGARHVDRATGDDRRDGLTQATAWRHGPGNATPFTPAASYIPAPGDTIAYRNGQRHLVRDLTGQTHALVLPTSGTTDNRIRLTGYGNGYAAKLSGAEDVSTGWTAQTSALAMGNPAGDLGFLQKRSVANARDWCFLRVGEQRLYPAQWPRPPALSEYENTAEGARCFRYVVASGDSMTWTGATVDPDTGEANTLIITSANIVPTGESIQSRYGAAGRSLVGARLIYRRDIGNVLLEGRIRFHNQATGVIKVAGLMADDAPFSNSSTENFYCIRYAQLDIGPGQYGWVNPATWNGAVETMVAYVTESALPRTIARLPRGYAQDRAHIEMDGIAFCDLAETGMFVHALEGSATATGSLMRNLLVEDCTGSTNLDSRTGMVQFAENAQYQDITVRNCLSFSGIRDVGPNASAAGYRVTRPGRTALFWRSAGANSTVSDVRIDDGDSVHGNGITDYGAALNKRTWRISAMNNVRPAAWGNQNGDNAPMGHVVDGAILSPRLTAVSASTPPALQDFTGVIDPNGDCTGSTWRNAMFLIGRITCPGRLIASAANPLQHFENCFIDGLSFQNAGSTNDSNSGFISLANCVVRATSGHATVPDLNFFLASTKGSSLNIAGTVIGDANGNANSVLFVPTTQTWEGMIWANVWEVISRDTASSNYGAGSPGAGIYLAKRLTSTWTLPVWGSTITSAMMTCGLTIDETYAGWPAWYGMCSVRDYPPQVMPSLPAGLGNNDLLEMFKGQIRPRAAGLTRTAGQTLTIVVRLTPQAAAGVTFESMSAVDVSFVLPVFA